MTLREPVFLYAAFNVGTDERHIAPIDEGGVALAAMRGLNEKVEARTHKSETSIRELHAENSELKERLSQLEQLAQKLTEPF